jgi:hypothetical protein
VDAEHRIWRDPQSGGAAGKRVRAFTRQRKEPLTGASHVKNALARFDQVEGVSDADRELAFANIKKAAAHYGVDVRENSWRELGSRR